MYRSVSETVLTALTWRFAGCRPPRLLWRLRPRFGAALLLTWALLNLLGGAVLSVLPLPFLPFVPEQSLRHYSFHLLYGLTQVPLIVAARTQLKAR